MPSSTLTRSLAAAERVTILVFSHLCWDLSFRRPQQVMTRVGRYCDVLFVEEPKPDGGAARLDVRAVAPGVEVVTPRLEGSASGFAEVHLMPLGRLLDALLAERRIRAPLAWFYAPMALPLLKFVEPRGIVYDCMEDFAAWPDLPPDLRLHERRLLDLADVVLAAGPSLHAARKLRRPDAQCLPDAVDADHFARRSLDPEGADAVRARSLHAAISEPRLGYAGPIDQRLDLRLIDDLAARRPDWSMVMAGTVDGRLEQGLPRRDNIHWLGKPSYGLLPHVLRHWNLALMPFALTAATRALCPAEPLECLAAGLRIVTTPLPDVMSLFGPLVRLAEGVDGFEGAIDDLLVPSGARADAEPLARDRVALLDASSWDAMVDQVMAAIRPWLGGVLAELPDRRLDAVGLEEPHARGRRSLRARAR